MTNPNDEYQQIYEQTMKDQEEFEERLRINAERDIGKCLTCQRCTFDRIWDNPMVQWFCDYPHCEGRQYREMSVELNGEDTFMTACYRVKREDLRQRWQAYIEAHLIHTCPPEMIQEEQFAAIMGAIEQVKSMENTDFKKGE